MAISDPDVCKKNIETLIVAWRSGLPFKSMRNFVQLLSKHADNDGWDMIVPHVDTPIIDNNWTDPRIKEAP